MGGLRRGVLATGPWRRAPLLLFRHPPVVAAVVGASLVLGSAAAVGPVFLSSSANAALARQVAGRCAFSSGVTVGTAPGVVNTSQSLGRLSGTVKEAAIDLQGLEGPVAELTTPLQVTSLTSGPHGDVRLLYRQGGLNQIAKLADAGGSGVWVTDTFAHLLTLRPGDQFKLASSENGASTATVRVRGVYRDMEYLPLTRFWCADKSYISPPSIFSETIPSPLILADEPTYRTITLAVGQGDTEPSWAWTLGRHVTVEQARNLVRGITRFEDAVSYRAGDSVQVHTELAFITKRAAAIRGAVRAGTSPASTAGMVVSLVLVAAAGSYWVDRRRIEVTMLAARGVGRFALGSKAVLEMMPAAIIGTAAGWGGALLLVRSTGPSSLVAANAATEGILRAVLAGAAGLAVLGVVAALRAGRLTERSLGSRPSWLRLVPLELAALFAALLAYQRLRHVHPALAEPSTRVPPVDSVLLIFPLLFLVGLVGVELRAAVFALSRLRRRGWRWADSLFLAARRLAAAPAAAALLLGATALSIGVLVYSATLTGSVRATLDAKAKVFVGSDLAVTMQSDRPLPAALGGRTTVVRRVTDATDAGQPVDLLGIDPATFQSGAFWDPSFAGSSLGSLVSRLTVPPPGGALPVLVANGTLADTTVSVRVLARNVLIPVRVVGRARTFPGEHHGQTALVAAWSGLAPYGTVIQREGWVRGPPGPALAALRQAGQPAVFEVEASTVLDGTDFLTSSWTFGYLRALGMLTGLITLGGMLLYLESRQRARRIAYALARRMGLTRAAHRASVAVELASALGPGLVAGAVLASVAAGLTYRHVDSAPLNPPGPLLLLPWSTYLATAGAVALAVVAGTWLTQRSAERTKVAEELRVAE